IKTMDNSPDPNPNTARTLPASQSAARTPAEELRQTLTALEKRVARVNELSADQAWEILELFDRAHQLRQRLQAAGKNLGSEDSQYETIQAQFYRRATRFLNQIGGAEVLAHRRRERQPDPDDWWWQIDLHLSEIRQARLRRAGLVGLIALLILSAAILAYQRFLAPDPEYIARISYQQQAENALLAANYETGLEQVEAALEYAPQDVELLILKGLLLEIQGENEAAQAAYLQAEQNASSPASFYEKRAAYYLMASLFEETIVAADQAIALNPESIMGYLQKAQAYDSMDRYPEAIENYEKADELAQQANNAQLQVIIRVNLSNVLQRYQSAIPIITAEP
ncbi:MAG: hypothetical protein JW862_00070, partial [Anaerolineales bacterium]|nr:hypothetical protein [Anaerolineales bacterium]